MNDNHIQSSTHPLRVGVVCAMDIAFKLLLLPQALALKEQGHEVIAICGDGPYVRELRDQGLIVHVVDISRNIQPVKDLVTVLQLRRLFKRLKLDVVHTHTPKASFVAQIAAKLARIPIRINTVHGFYYWATPPGLKRTLFKKLEITSCRLATFNLSQSQEDVDLVARENILPPEKFQWLGNGIDLTRFCPGALEPETRQNVLREFDLPDDCFIVGILARMVTEKGFHELFQAFAKFRELAPNAYLLHVGMMDTARNLEFSPDQPEYAGIQMYCRFAGQRDDVPRLMGAMDVFCLPSYREGYPRSVMEANAMGVPAIVTDIRGCREAVIDEHNGLLVPVGQVEPLYEAILRLYRDQSLRQEISRNAIARAHEVFDENRVIKTVLDVYERLSRESNATRTDADG